MGIPFSTWIPGIHEPPTIDHRQINSLWPSGYRAPTRSFAATLQEHMAYQDLDDVLRAMATGTAIDTNYDQPGKAPYLQRWKQLQQDLLIRNYAVGIQKFSGDPMAGFRDGPAASDGDIILEDRQKYFQVNDDQIKTLKANPYIEVKIAQYRHPKTGSLMQVARYEYPTAKDYEKFSWWLDANFKGELDAAKANGTFLKPDDPKHRELTKKLLQYLVDRMAYLPVIPRHYLLTSLHPFSTMNTEAIASLFTTGSPIKILNSGLRTIPGKPDEVLLTRVEDFAARLYSNGANTLSYLAAFADLEDRSPKDAMIKYFDVPELWQAGRGIAKIQTDPASVARFVAESKKRFAKIGNCYATQLAKALK
jgi:hypothetical protein